MQNGKQDQQHNNNSSKEAQMFSGGRSRTQVKACISCDPLCCRSSSGRRRVVPPAAAATRWVRHIKGNGAKIWHAVSSCLECRSEHWPQMQLQLQLPSPSPSPSLYLALLLSRRFNCFLVFSSFFSAASQDTCAKSFRHSEKIECVCRASLASLHSFAMLRIMRRMRVISAVLCYLPCAEVHVVSCGEYRSVSLLITSICSSVSCTASRCCASQGT